MTVELSLAERAQVYRALGDPARLAVAEALDGGDLSPGELAEATGLRGNLLAFHLGVLEAAGLVVRRRSEGDGRKRYVGLTARAVAVLPARSLPSPRARPRVLFVCTHNSARSQFASAQWSRRTGLPAQSAGCTPAERVHPAALRVAREQGYDLSTAAPSSYAQVLTAPQLVVSVCDRAKEAGHPFHKAAQLHWSVADPVAKGSDEAFAAAFDDIAWRVQRLAAKVGR